MPLPRVRFTVRRMIVAVAIAGTFLGIWVRFHQRGDRFQTICDRHGDRILAIGDELMRGEYDGKYKLHEKRLNYAVDMMRKYDRAARFPFLPVAPDPPEPE